MENDPDLEFRFYLADRLHMTVADMSQKMTHSEFVLWTRFHGRRAQQMELERLKMGG